MYLPVSTLKCFQMHLRPNPWATWSHCPCSASHLPGQWKLLSSGSPAPIQVAWKGGMGSHPGLWYILGLELLLSSATQPLNLKKHLDASVPLRHHVGLRMRKFQPLWLGNGVTSQVFRRAYSEDVGCLFLKFYIALVELYIGLIFWFKSFLNALTISFTV